MKIKFPLVCSSTKELVDNYKEYILTIHWKNECIPVKGIKCGVKTETHNRNSQPYCVVRGFAENVTIRQQYAFIN